MAVEINHACGLGLYMIKEYYKKDNDGELTRYIMLDTDEMKQLSKLLEEEGF